MFTIDQVADLAKQNGLIVYMQFGGRSNKIEIIRHSPTAQAGYENQRMALFSGTKGAVCFRAVHWFLNHMSADHV